MQRFNLLQKLREHFQKTRCATSLRSPTHSDCRELAVELAYVSKSMFSCATFPQSSSPSPPSPSRPTLPLEFPILPTEMQNMCKHMETELRSGQRRYQNRIELENFNTHSSIWSIRICLTASPHYRNIRTNGKQANAIAYQYVHKQKYSNKRILLMSTLHTF